MAEPQSGSETMAFGDRIAGHVLRRQSQLVLGLDPDPAALWPEAVELAGATSARGGPHEPRHDRMPVERAAHAVVAHCALVLEAAASQCVAVKLQLACFERLGAQGWAALGEVAACARSRGLLVLADGKRADVDISAAAYGQAFFGQTPTAFGPVEGLGADALTVNPLLGLDSLRPLVVSARERGCGLFVLVRTSNAGARDVQELELAEGGTVADRLAGIVAELGADGLGQSGLADVGAVVGATAPGRLEPLRQIMPHAVFLLPGVGPQGGEVEALAAAFAPGPAGALISSSRGIVNAHQHAGGDPASAAAREAERLRSLAWELASG